MFVTPDELIFKNFNTKEIKVLKSDPYYFRVKNENFKDTFLNKHKTLTERLRDEEDMDSNILKEKRNVIKISKSQLKRYFLLSITLGYLLFILKCIRNRTII